MQEMTMEEVEAASGGITEWTTVSTAMLAGAITGGLAGARSGTLLGVAGGAIFGGALGAALAMMKGIDLSV